MDEINLAKFLELFSKTRSKTSFSSWWVSYLSYNEHQPLVFLGSLVSNSFLRYIYIFLPTRITSHSKNIIASMFSKFYFTWNNLVIQLQQHLTNYLKFYWLQIFILNLSIQKSNFHERDWSRLVNQQNLNISMESFLSNMNSIMHN